MNVRAQKWNDRQVMLTIYLNTGAKVTHLFLNPSTLITFSIYIQLHMELMIQSV